MKYLWLPLTLLFSLSSCLPEPAAQESHTAKAVPTAAVQDEPEGLKLLKTRCIACHGVGQKTHEQLIAPPLIAMKRRYLMQHPDKESFVSQMVAFVQKPTKESALMYGAVDRFGLMAPLPLPEAELRTIAAYIFEEEMEKPEWFEAHFQEMHPDGIPD